MRLFTIGLLIVLFVPLAAYAQAAKQVEVTNLPAVQEVTGAVEVTNDTANPVEVTGDVTVANLPPPTAAARYQLVGFTAATLSGQSGVLALTLACQLEFPGSRMCASREVIETVSIPDNLNLTGMAWVRPSFVPHTSPGDLVVDASGFSNSVYRGSLSCGGWAPQAGSGSDLGLSLTVDGSFRESACQLPIAVSCCAPVP